MATGASSQFFFDSILLIGMADESIQQCLRG